MAGPPSILILCAVVCMLTLSAFTEAANDEARIHTDKEIQEEYKSWIGRMVQKHAEQTAATTTLADTVSFAEGPAEKTIYVAQSGGADFKSLTSAIKAIPDGSSTRYVILVAAGTYKEKVRIPKGKGPISLIGAGSTKTKITYDDDNNSAGGTLKSSSVTVYSNDFIAKDITFENSRPAPTPGAIGEQAVAFTIIGDKAAFYRVAFLGYQDTLYDRAGRHYFKDCYIRGSIDFIFGDGHSYYETSYLDSVARTFGSLSAQKRLAKQDDSGFSFVNCIVNGPQGYIYLGRAWGPYSRVVFIKTYLPVSVRPEGWFDWGIPGRSKTVYYGEYQCYGPGAARQGRESWSFALSPAQAAPFLTTSWIQGDSWIPKGLQ